MKKKVSIKELAKEAKALCDKCKEMGFEYVVTFGDFGKNGASIFESVNGGFDNLEKLIVTAIRSICRDEDGDLDPHMYATFLTDAIYWDKSHKIIEEERVEPL